MNGMRLLRLRAWKTSFHDSIDRSNFGRKLVLCCFICCLPGIGAATSAFVGIGFSLSAEYHPRASFRPEKITIRITLRCGPSSDGWKCFRSSTSKQACTMISLERNLKKAVFNCWTSVVRTRPMAAKRSKKKLILRQWHIPAGGNVRRHKK